MGKKTVDIKKDNNSGKTRQIQKDEKQNKVFSLSFKATFQEFLHFLKGCHGVNNKENDMHKEKQKNVNQYFEQVTIFFMREKKYTQEQLQLGAICLANFINAFPHKTTELAFTHQFHTKLRYLLVRKQTQKSLETSILQAVLYILVMLIYKERTPQAVVIRDFNKTIYCDRQILKVLMSLKVPQDKKLKKLYGIILVHLINQVHGKKNKENLIKSILLHMNQICHDQIFFNLLVYLRAEKNIVTINYMDVIKGKLFQVLIQKYLKHIDSNQAFLILDYLRHLLELFPSLAPLIDEKFPYKLLSFIQSKKNQYPLHETAIIQFLQTNIRFLPKKKELIEKIIELRPSNHRNAIQLGKLVMDMQLEREKIMQLLLSGYFEFIFQLLRDNIEVIIVRKAIEITKYVIRNILQINRRITASLCDSLLLRIVNLKCDELRYFENYVEYLRKQQLTLTCDYQY